MKILISHVYSNDNNGDAALLSVLLSDISRAFGKADITILTMDHVKEGEVFEGVPVRNSFMYHVRESRNNPIARMFYGIYAAVGTLVWTIARKYFKLDLPIAQNLRGVLALYEEADLIIPVGGGYIRGKSGFSATATLLFIVHPFFISHILGKTTVGHTQSIGPFGNHIQAFMAKLALKRVSGIIVREEISLELLKKFGITQNVFMSVDGGFSFVSNKARDIRDDIDIPKKQIIIGVTVRSWLRADKQLGYERAVANLSDHIIRKYNACVVFIPQVTVEHHNDDDREVGNRVYALMRYKNDARVMNGRYDHHSIKSMYAGLDYLVGTRFHSVIFALTSFVPSIAIEYEYKTRGIMRSLGLDKWVVSIDEINETKLIRLFDQLAVERKNYISNLNKILPSYIQKGKKSIDHIKSIYINQQIMKNKTHKLSVVGGKVRASVLLVGLIIIIFFIAMSSITIKNSVFTPNPNQPDGLATTIPGGHSGIWPNGIPDDVAPPVSASDVGHSMGIAAGSGLSKASVADINYQLDQIVKAGIKWVRFDIEWGLVQYGSPDKSDWSSYDKLVDALHVHDLDALAILVFTPEWARDPKCSGGAKCPPKDPKQFAKFATEAVERYKGKGVHYWEVWNEPNSYNFWATKADCKAYTELLKATYPAIKQADSDAFVITGGVAPAATDKNNVSRLDFLSCIYKNGGKNYFDAVGDHPYTFPNLPSSDKTNNWAQMSVTDHSLRSIMVANGDEKKKIWITEYGTPTNGPDARWYVSETKQAEMVADTLTLYKTYDWAGPLFWYTIKDNGTSKETSENFFGLMRADSTLKPAYYLMKEMIGKGI